MHRYTAEEHEFLKEIIPGHSYREIQELFNKKFDSNITLNMIKGYLGNHKLSTGRTGYFPKGHTPANKGLKGVSYPGMEKNQFKPGNIPANHREVGSERISKDGYIEIKVAEPNKWRLKHRVVWEQNFGKVPTKHALVFKDQNKLNVTIDNLVLVTRGDLARLNQNKLLFNNPNLTEAGINIAKVLSKIGERK